MRKVTKILAKVISAFVLLSIFLPVSVTLLLNVRGVQNYVVDVAADYASDMLGTEVSIGRVDLDLFAKLRLTDVCVKDTEGDTLIYAGMAKARIASLDIKRDGLCLSAVELHDAEVCLRELPSGKLNITAIIEKLSNPNKKSNFRLYISDIELNNVRFVYERRAHKNPIYGVDYADMDFRNLSGRVTNLAIAGGDISLSLEDVSAIEKSGFDISNLTTRLKISKGSMFFDDAYVLTPHSNIVLRNLYFEAESWADYSQFADRVTLDIATLHSTISAKDLAYFIPALRDKDVAVDNTMVDFHGTINNFVADIHSLAMGEDLYLEAKMSIGGITSWRDADYFVNLERLYARSPRVLAIVDEFANKSLSDRVREIIGQVEWVDASLLFDGRFDNFLVDGNVDSGIGAISADATAERIAQGRYSFKGDVGTAGLDIGKLLKKEKIGNLSVALTTDMLIGSGFKDLCGDVDAQIRGFEFGGYNYHDISLHGTVDGRAYYAELHSEDENLLLDLFGAVDLDAENPTYDLALSLERADLVAMGFNKRDDVSVLSLQMGAQAVGHNFDDLCGELSIADINYEFGDSQLYSDLATLAIDGNSTTKTVDLDSDFFSIDYKSQLGYRDVYNYLYNALRSYVPMLYSDDAPMVAPAKQIETDVSDFTVVEVRTNESINDLLAIFSDKLFVAPDTRATLMFNAENNSLKLNVESEALDYGGLIVADTRIDILNEYDSLKLWMQAGSLYWGTRRLTPEFDVTGSLHDNQLSFTAGFGKPEDKVSGMLGMTMLFRRDEQTRARSMHIDITPSFFTTETQQWKLFSQGIDIESGRISVNNLLIARPEQQLLIDGVASRSREDSISLRLHNFDLSPLSALVSKWGYKIVAKSNGYATVKSALRYPEIDARIDLDSINVNGMNAPAQVITSRWDFEQNRARLLMCDSRTSDTIIRGYYRPKGNRYFAQADIKRLDMNVIAPFLKGIVSDIEGKADVRAEIMGEGRIATLNGSAELFNIGATVDYTNTRYEGESGRLRVENNHIYSDGIPLYDVEGNEGRFYMDLSLEHLSNIAYSIDIEADNLLVLDTDAKDNDLFYGHVFASGNASFKGDKRGTKMNIEATSCDKSIFFMPLLGKEDVSYAEFVRFRKPEVVDVDTAGFLKRRMMAYERRNRPVNTAGSVFDMDMNFNILPNAEIQLVIDPTVGDVIKGRGEGQLAMHIVPKTNVFEMRGEYVINEGTYLFTMQNIWNKKFKVEKGSSVLWTGDPLGATLNVNAVYEAKASLKPLIGNSLQGIDTSRAVPVNCWIKLTDELMKPTVTFDIEVPNVAPEIQTVIRSALNDQQSVATQMFWLLAANTFSAEDTGTMGASFSTTTGFELLSNQLSNWLSGDDYNIILRYRPRSELSGDEVDFGFSKSLLNDRLIIEVEGGYLSDASLQATNRASNFVGEAFITWLIDSEGSFRFKGFTQTIDRYGENQGMQEAGVGLYYSESFNTFADLAKSLRNKFINDERRENRRKRREERSARREERKSGKSTPTTVLSNDAERLPEVVIKDESGEDDFTLESIGLGELTSTQGGQMPLDDERRSPNKGDLK